jgi:uncharacterized protein YeaO (DUF488 family)
MTFHVADELRTVNVYTVQIGQWRKVKALGLEMYDTTVRSRNPYVAPTWDMVLGHKSGEITDAEYTFEYLLMMEKSVRDHHAWWMEFIRRENIVLACYCKSGRFCHRYLLKDIVKQLCDENDLVFVDKGEIA